MSRVEWIEFTGIDMRKEITVLAFWVVLFALCSSAEAQQPKKVSRVGYLAGPSRSSMSARTEACRQGLRERGYIEGKNIVMEYRYAEGRLERVPVLAAELVHLGVDIIVTAAATPTRAAKKATVTIPIIMTNDNDPVGNGFVASLARPGGNITGMASLSPELSGKRLELLKEIVPTLSRVAAIGTSTNPGNARSLKETELAAGPFAVRVQYLDIISANDIEPAFQRASKGRAEAVLALGGPLLADRRKQLIDLAAKSRLPAIYWRSDIVEAGGLMSYGVYSPDLDRRAATYVDKILKGAKPAELPIEQPTKFELFFNLQSAKKIGLTIPPNVLARADRVIR